MVSVDDGPDGDAVANPAGYGDITYLTDLFASKADVEAITGSLIPEPSVLGLLAGAILALLVRRRVTRH